MWSWVLEAIGMTGALLVGRKHWWSWSLLAVNSLLWAIYGFNTGQYGFCFAGLFYFPIYTRNLILWKKGKR
jgi:hypothetical protein